MTSPRIETLYVTLFAVLGHLVGIPSAHAQAQTPPGFEHCRTIADDQARLDCLKKLLSPPEPASESGHAAWPLVVTHRPPGGPDAVAIMRTADTSRSDPDFAGLMIRCSDKSGFEVLLAVVRPFPPRARRQVVIGSGSGQTVLQAQISSLGTGFILPVESTVFTTGAWKELKELAVLIKDPQGNIRGVVPLDGLAPAMGQLSARCPSG